MNMELRVATGTLLASSPDLLDPNFMHSLSVMCEHTEEGAYGLVVNKQSSLTLDRLLPDEAVFGKLALPVWWGGPVGSDTLQVLHRIPEHVPSGVSLGDGLYLGATLEELAEFAAGREAREITDSCRFILGYAGWGAGQLEGELSSGSWLPLRLDVDLVFQYAQEPVWQRAVRSLGEDGHRLAVMPPDLGWN
jgi:putative transcriptional regulator